MELLYPFGIRVLERVDRLILVTDDCQFRVPREQTDDLLFGDVEVLIFVDENLRKIVKVLCRRIASEVTQGFRYELTDQHRPMKS